MELKTPPVLKPGDRVAVVSLSSGMLGDSSCNHSRELGIRRLAEFGLKTVYMPHSLMGSAYLAEHPEQRAEDLKAAFSIRLFLKLFIAA